MYCELLLFFILRKLFEEHCIESYSGFFIEIKDCSRSQKVGNNDVVLFDFSAFVTQG